MALIVSAASGNFNAGATWVGGVVPTVGDEARASDTHTITITANATCDEVSNAGTGIFTLNSGVTLTANVTSKSATQTRNCLQFTAASPATATIVGNCTGGTANASVAVANISSGTLTITGNATGGSGGLVSLTGAFGANNTSTGTLTITGNATGGSGSSAFGANNTSTGTLTITGNATGGSGSNAYGANNASTGTMTIVGTINASEFNYGVGGGNRGQVTLLTGPFIASTTFGVNPIGNLSWRWAASLNDQTYITVPTNNLLATRNLVTPDNATNFPSASNVRSGTTYGISNSLTGTCAVPPAASVAFGVPVDNTTGTATLSAADIWSYATREITGGTVDTLVNAPDVPTAEEIATEVWDTQTSALTTSGAIGTRLKNSSTVATTGAQLAAALS